MTVSLRHDVRRVHDAPVRTRGAGAALWALAALGPLLLVVGGITDLVASSPRGTWDEFAQNVYPNVVFGGALPLLGALILSRIPRHAVGRLFLCCGLVSAATLPLFGYGRLALYDHPGQLPLGGEAAWVSAWLWALGFMPLVTLGVLLFPDGRLPSRRWRPVLVIDVLAVALVAAAVAFTPGPLANHPIADNPVSIPLPHAVFAVARAVGGVLFVVGLVAAVASAVVRWRRAQGVERSQLVWFALAVALLLTAVLLPVPAVGDVLFLVAVPLLPFAVTVAILRRNLYGIEVVVRRSLVYGALSVLLLAGYGAVVAVVGALAQNRTSPAATLLGAGVVAVAFAPLRERLQQSVDRLLYGDRRNPYAVLTGVGRRLDAGPESGGDVLAAIVETVATSLRLPYARVDLSPEDGAPVAAEWGEVTPHVHAVPLTYRGSGIGTLLVGRRTPHEAFGATDLRLLDDLGRQVGVAAHATLLGRDLQRSREELVTTREEERRRIRRDLHDGLGPALAGVALGLDAINRIAATRAEEAAVLADQLKHEVQASLADVRRLVEDLRPPALDQLGLVGAVRQQADHLSERDPALAVAVEAVRMPPLPAAVEVAVYRIATEALTNVARHAAARSCCVAITIDEAGWVVVEVQDDGVGMRPTSRPGVGTTAMRERAVELGGTCETTTLVGGGTKVTARIPAVVQ